jgi:hypothetical protein
VHGRGAGPEIFGIFDGTAGVDNSSSLSLERHNLPKPNSSVTSRRGRANTPKGFHCQSPGFGGAAAEPWVGIKPKTELCKSSTRRAATSNTRAAHPGSLGEWNSFRVQGDSGIETRGSPRKRRTEGFGGETPLGVLTTLRSTADSAAARVSVLNCLSQPSDADRPTLGFIYRALSGRSLILRSPTQGVALGCRITALQADTARRAKLWNL